MTNDTEKMREDFEMWADRRGVWPRLTHEEIFLAGVASVQPEIDRLTREGAIFKAEWEQISETARVIHKELAEVTAQRDRLQAFAALSLRLYNEALPRFNWGASALDANAIFLLNEFGINVRDINAEIESTEKEKIS